MAAFVPLPASSDGEEIPTSPPRIRLDDYYAAFHTEAAQEMMLEGDMDTPDPLDNLLRCSQHERSG